MADNPVISQITLPNGSTYDIKDSTARAAIANINSFDYVICNSAATTPSGVVWDNSGASVTGSLAASADTKGKMYLVPSTNGTKNIYDEYITIETGASTFVWELFGHTNVGADDLGDLAYKNSATGSYTPAGSVSGGSFTGASMTSTGSFTPSGSVAVSSAGSTDTVYSITDVGSLPSLTTTVSDENLTIGFSQGTLPTKGSAQTVKTGDASYSFSGTEGSVSVSGTTTGSVSAISFSGTAATITVT